MKVKKILSYEWDAIAGILAAVIGIILHLLHIVNEDVILPIVLALIALLFINFMRHTRSNDLTHEELERTGHIVRSIHSTLKQSDIVLVGPRHLRSVNEKFTHDMGGDTVWFNVCLSMYKSQHLFDTLLRPAIENSMVRSVQFVLDESQKALWADFVQPKIVLCTAYAKVREPHWCKLDKNISFILADSQHSGGAEALLSFWGEPFMAQSTGKDIPRYIFHVQKNSELLIHLADMERRYLHD
ncbi:hypothetical protein AU255_17905 [Methyloprofundus sedimenti]|uniref:Uncharacterized protein n=1 Tax=Methyloprofundus sedimenti TaxID=1420851 RepID=A0A1V8M1H5_9GAMM|nr:hypothetical protein [Methyloprofundus sedimenti]OQK15346.1 hypothetical protein AU255_17905 [Methyloprofundus sedimenti]